MDCELYALSVLIDIVPIISAFTSASSLDVAYFIQVLRLAPFTAAGRAIRRQIDASFEFL